MDPILPFFNEMDFIGLDKPHDEEFLYKASDVLVQSTWELPIVVQWPHSQVFYEFTSQPNDISFAIVFVAAPEEPQNVEDLEIETIEESSIVPSSSERISGSFEVPCEGVIFFLWDNNFDWSAVKKISYSIRVIQTSFTTPDKERCRLAGESLSKLSEDLEMTYIRHADASSLIENNSVNVIFLEDQVQKLESRLCAKKREIDELKSHLDQCNKAIVQFNSCRPGLCVRMLSKYLLSLVMDFLSDDSEVGLVSKYWLEVSKVAKLTIEEEACRKLQETKLDKKKRSRLLFEIRLNQQNHSTNGCHDLCEGLEILLAKTEPGGVSDKDPSDVQVNKEYSKGMQPLYSTAATSTPLLANKKKSSSQKAAGALEREQKSDSALLISFDHVHPQFQVISNSPKSDDLKLKPPIANPRVTKLAAINNLSNISQQSQSFDKQQGLQSSNAKVSFATANKRKSHRKHMNDGKVSELLHNLHEIRSKQQISAIIEYVEAGTEKIKHLMGEKKRVRKLIKAWNASYERANGRVPTSSERKGHLRELHEEYQQIRQEKLEETLKRLGLDRQKYEEVKQFRSNQL